LALINEIGEQEGYTGPLVHFFTRLPGHGDVLWEPVEHEVNVNPAITVNRNFDDRDYYVIEFRTGAVWGEVALENFIPADFLKRLQNGDKDAILILSNSHEGYTGVLEYIYKGVVLQYNIPPKNIILVTGAFSIQPLNEAKAKEHDVDTINIEIGMDFELATQEHLQYQIEDVEVDFPETLVDKQYTHSFLNLNRRWRMHRPLFVALMVAHGLIDRGLVSFGPSDDNRDWHETWLEIENLMRDYPLDFEYLSAYKHKIINMPPRYIDTDELVTNRARMEGTEGPMYANTYFSLVSETHYFEYQPEHSVFFSEKVFKPIAFKHPFILIAPPFSLAALKSLGYKTFPGLIDESYDTEKNDIKRMLKILEETRRLDSLNGAELSDWLAQAKEICEYNYTLLRTKDTWFHGF
jgi:hypothetical protein